MSRSSTSLVRKYPLISDQVDTQELVVLLEQLELILDRYTAGAVVEFGCYAGTTSLFIRRLLDIYGGDHDFHVYDSFEGLPPKTKFDESAAGDQFRTGELSASRKTFTMNFKKAGLRLPYIHKGWFHDLDDEAVPSDIVFAFLDGDYYESIRDSLRLITPKLTNGATIVIDDYASEALPGAYRATEEWARTHGVTVRAVSSLGIIHLP